MIAFDIVLATAFSWMSSVADYNRYCKDEKSSVLGISTGYLVGTIIAMVMGVLVGAITLIRGLEPSFDPTRLFESSGSSVFAVIAAIVMLLSVLSTNVMALYSAIMSTMSVVPKVSFLKITVVLGIIFLAGAGFKEVLVENFFNWILLVGTLFIPVFAIIVSDFFILEKGHYDSDELLNEKGIYSYGNRINLIAIIICIIGAGFSYYFTYIDPLSIGSTVLTFGFTALTYVIFSKLIKKSKII